MRPFYRPRRSSKLLNGYPRIRSHSFGGQAHTSTWHVAQKSWRSSLIRPEWRLKGARRLSNLSSNHVSTIYALSTAPGRAAIAIIRISGPACLQIYQALCPGKSPLLPRYATLRTLYEPGKQRTEAQVLDSGALVLHFPAPDTATGEDVLELHVHGGTAIVKAVLAAIPKAVPKENHPTIRYAEPGEFTRRAFYNDRLDLLQIEALGDTLSADTEQQRRLAVRGSTGVLAERYEAWRQKLLYARGELEALIDFSEDQHFDESPAQLCASVAGQVLQLRSQLRANMASASRGELLRNGIHIALIGVPNAGKSSLLNEIVGREAAIVSSEAGTTRDIVEVNVDVGGFFCKFGDMAGLRKEPLSTDKQQIGQIEQEGMRRARERALAADVVIAVLPAKALTTHIGRKVTVDVGPELLEVLKQCNVETQKIVCVLNKADLFDNPAHVANQRQKFRRHPVLRNYFDHSETTLYPISCKYARDVTSESSDSGGIQAFLDGMTHLFRRMTSAVVPEDQKVIGDNSAWAESLGATERQRTLLQQCLGHLESFLAEVKVVEKEKGKSLGEIETTNKQEQAVAKEGDEVDIVLAAESLRFAADCLSKITGKGEAGDVEEVLGVVFEKFCVGK